MNLLRIFLENFFSFKGVKRTIKGVKITIVFCVLLTSCQSKKLDYTFPASDATCRANINWMTLKPGISTREDVISVLGQPNDKGKIKFADGKSVPFFAYNINGKISPYAKHRIFFYSDGRIYWIEEIVADQDGQFHTVRETVEVLGDTLDIVYENNDFNPFADFQIDVISGPDQIYVWSECGVALLALSGVIKTDDGNLKYETTSSSAKQVLTIRYPELSYTTTPVTSLNRVVMMKFLFQPSTYEYFMENYSYKIPCGLWRDYLSSIQNTIE